MKLPRPILSQTRERYFEWILVGLILIMGSLLFYQALPFLNGTLGAITLYILLRRVNLLLSARFSPSIAPWIITIAVTIFVLIPLSIFLWYLIDLVQSVNFDVQVIIKRFTDTIRYLERTTNLQIVSEKSVAFITAKGTAFVNSLMAGINNAAINLFTTILILFFLLAGGVKMEIAIARCLPFSDNNKHTIINKVSTIVRSNAIGIPLLAMIQGGVAAVGYWICGVNNPIEFGALTGFASMIPIVGSMLVWIPLAIVQYFEQGTAASIYVALYGVIVISQCDNVLRMFMQKRMANTHPLITIFGVIAGLPLFGFMGLIFGPLLVAMFLLFLEMFIKQYIIGDDLSLQDAKAKRARTFDPQSSIKAKHKSQEEFIAQATIKSKQLKNRAQIKHQNKQELLSGKQSSPASKASTSASASASTSTSSTSAASASTNAASAESSALASTATNTSANAQAKANNKARDKAITSTKNTAKNKADFKTSKAEIKQQKRQAAKLRVQEEQEANERELAKKTLSVPKREPINLAERSLLNFNHTPDNNHLSDDAPGKNMVARAVSQAINSFDKFDDLDGNMAFGGSELFKDDYLTANTKQQLAKKRRFSKMDLEQKPIPFVQANDLPSSACPSSDEATKAQANAPEHSANEASNEPVLSSKTQNKGSKEQKTEHHARNARSNRKDRKDKAHRNDRNEKSERNERSERSERNERPERNERSEHNSRKDRAHAKASDRHNKKNDRSSSYERKKSNSKASRTRKSHDSHKSRRDNLGYQTMRSERSSAVAQEPVIRTVVSHQYGNFDLNKSRSSGLKTQLVSMHTAKGTVMAQPPRRRPSKRRPYH